MKTTEGRFRLAALMGGRLATRRKNLGMLQTELCERAGISRATLSHVENGKTLLNTAALVRVCRVLRVTPNDLLWTEDEL